MCGLRCGFIPYKSPRAATSFFTPHICKCHPGRPSRSRRGGARLRRGRLHLPLRGRQVLLLRPVTFAGVWDPRGLQPQQRCRAGAGPAGVCRTPHPCPGAQRPLRREARSAPPVPQVPGPPAQQIPAWPRGCFLPRQVPAAPQAFPLQRSSAAGSVLRVASREGPRSAQALQVGRSFLKAEAPPPILARPGRLWGPLIEFTPCKLLPRRSDLSHRFRGSRALWPPPLLPAFAGSTNN